MPHDLSLNGRRRHNRLHPMFQPNGYWLDTDMADDFFDHLCEWIELLKSGLCLTGDSLVGKTSCVRNVLSRVRAEYPNVAVSVISGERDTARASQDRFLRNCLEQIRKSSRGQGETLCARLSNHLINECRAVDGRVMVCFLDEGQVFQPEEYDALRNIWNRMGRDGYALLVYTVGNEELIAKGSMENDAGRHGNVGRFFVKFDIFKGVTSEAALARILAQFDQALVYPNVHWPYSRYFASQAFDEGWRLADESAQLHAALLAVKGATGTSDNFSGWCMGPLLKCVHAMFKDALLSDGHDPHKAQIDWQAILNRHTQPYLLCRRL